MSLPGSKFGGIVDQSKAYRLILLPLDSVLKKNTLRLSYSDKKKREILRMYLCNTSADSHQVNKQTKKYTKKIKSTSSIVYNDSLDVGI
jgi:hypothetical protein